MRLVVGLGNPGPEYEWTPHNMGFLAVDALAERAKIRVTRPESKALVGRGQLAGHEIVLAKPQTMMNLSGVAVRMLLERYECETAETIVLIDEMPVTAVGKIFKPRLREIAAEAAARDALGAVLDGAPFEVSAAHNERGLILKARVSSTSAEAARAELGKLPVGFELELA